MTYYLPLLGVLLLYIFYKFFLHFFVEYLLAGYKLGFNNIAMIYKPLSSYGTLYKQSVKKYKHTLGHIQQILKKNPNVKIIFVRVFGITHLTITDPEFIRKMSFDYVTHLKKRQFIIFYQQIEHGLIFAEDELWKKSRKLMSNMFHFDILESRSNIMEEVVVKQTKDLDLQKPDLFKLGCSIGGEIVLKSLFGSDYYNVDFDGRNPYEEINELMLNLLTASRGLVNMLRIVCGIKLNKDSKYMTDREKKCLKRLINFKEKSKEYLRLENEKYKNGQEVTQFMKAYFDLNQPNVYEQTVQQLFLFLLAGEDTTGALISSCLLSLAQNPKYQSSILEDVQKHGVHASKQLNNFINEVNRISAPVQNSLTRRVTKPFTIDNYTFKTNTPITFGIGNVMNNVKYWDNPQQFAPQRFNHPIENPSAYIPFSSGPRNCIGQHMAMMEVRLTLVRVLQNYRLEQEGDASVIINRGVVNLPLNQHTVKFTVKELAKSN